MNGTIIGYDPGGNGSHGVAALRLQEERITEVNVDTLETVEHVIRWMGGIGSIVGLRVDTLTCWGTGPGGWRDADLWLRENRASARTAS